MKNYFSLFFIMNSNIELIRSLLKTNPELIKSSLELAIQCQTTILDKVKKTGMKVICESRSYDSVENIPKDEIILLTNDYKQQIQALHMEVTEEVANDDFVNEMETYVDNLVNLNDNFDNITAEDIINIDLF